MSTLASRLVPLISILCGCAAHAQETVCQYPQEARSLVTDWSGEIAAKYRAALQAGRRDAATLFLVGVSNLPKHSPDAVRDFESAIAVDSHYPWPYFALMDVYATLQPDSAKLAANTNAYRNICPADLDAYRYLSRLSDPAETARLAKELRSLLGRTKSAPELTHYKDLWSAEFRSTPPANFGEVRTRIRDDLKRLEPLAQSDRSLIATLQTGYELSGQPEAAQRAALEAASLSEPAPAHYQSWNKQHPMPRSSEERHAYHEAQRKEAEELAARWPASRMSWNQMLQTASNSEEASQAGAKVLELNAGEPEPGPRAAAYSAVAMSWLRYGIRPKDVPLLEEQALRDLDRREQDAGAPVVKSSAKLQTDLYYELVRWDAWNTLLDASIGLGDLNRAAQMPKDMQAWLAAHPLEPDTPRSLATFYPRWEGFISVAQGKVAESQGRKADALAYYQRVLIGPARQYPGNLALPRALWKDLGGTEEGWLAWSKPTESQPTVEPSIPKPAVASRDGSPAGWNRVTRPLGNRNLSDFSGRSWTLADVKGKVTLINVWASWCGPCTAELPHVQELYDKIKTRTDVQLITINVDENPGLSDAFIKREHYTFPVLMAAGYFTNLQPDLSIPRSWIVDRDGSVRLEKIDSNLPGGSPTWAQDVLDQMLR